MKYRPHKRYIGQIISYDPDVRSGSLETSDGTKFRFDTPIRDFAGRPVSQSSYVTFQWGRHLQSVTGGSYIHYAKNLEQLT